MTCVYSTHQDTESEPFLEAKFRTKLEAEAYAEDWNRFYPNGDVIFYTTNCN